MKHQSYFHQTISWEKLVIFSFILLAFSSCQKDFLDKKPDRSKLVPVTVADFQAILDNLTFTTGPGLQEVSSDDFTTTDQGLLSISTLEVSAYTWSPSIFTGLSSVQDWGAAYQHVFNANVVLEGLDQIIGEERDNSDYNAAKGTALFYRACDFYNIAQLFAAPYVPATAPKLPGVPVRLISDINIKSARGTVQQVYDQVIKDLQAALPLLPDQVAYKSRPCKAAVLAMLARVYLTMGNYTAARDLAGQALQLRPDLLDYNQIKGTATDRIMPPALPNGNAEVIYYKNALAYSFPASGSLVSVVPELYAAYANNDLRKTLFFRNRGNGVFSFRGSYSGNLNSTLFTGVATDELYLIRAECAARANDLTSALNDLNKLLATRWNKGTFIPYTGTDQETVLRTILLERRKELIGRGIRWTDLRRLNLDPKFQLTLSRTVNGKLYQLLPNGNRYVFPLPDNEILLGGLEQNP